MGSHSCVIVFVSEFFRWNALPSSFSHVSCHLPANAIGKTLPRDRTPSEARCRRKFFW